jgi:uncharacterized protein (DUF2345 family)
MYFSTKHRARLVCLELAKGIAAITVGEVSVVALFEYAAFVKSHHIISAGRKSAVKIALVIVVFVAIVTLFGGS